jgi:hypothetical protein
MRSMVEGVRRVSALASQTWVILGAGAAGIAPPPPHFVRSPSPYGGGPAATPRRTLGAPR